MKAVNKSREHILSDTSRLLRVFRAKRFRSVIRFAVLFLPVQRGFR